jgi:predicted metal-dependent hydrolase
MKKNERMEAWLEVWDTDAHSPLPAEYRAFFACFNRGEYYEAHDALEHLWLRCHDSNRSFYQALIQFAGAFVHLQKHCLFPGHPTHSRRLAPARRLFALAAERLGAYPKRHLALNLGGVLALGAHWSALAGQGPSPLAVHPPPRLCLESDSETAGFSFAERPPQPPFRA